MVGYKKFLFLFPLFLNFLLFANNSAIIDTTQTSADSLSFYKLNSDSLRYPNKSEIIKNLKLKQSLQTKADKIPFLFNENLHFYVPFNDYTIKNIEGFTLYNPNFTSSLYYQLFFPVYSIKIGEDTRFEQKLYSEMVPVLLTYAGIGSQNMNFAYIDFFKGLILKKIDLNFSFITQSGNWNLQNGYLKNIHLFTRYNFTKGHIGFASDIIKNDLPGFYFTTITDLQNQINFKLMENTILFNYANFYSGLRYEKTTEKDTTSFTDKKLQFFLKQNIKLQRFKVTPKYELSFNDTLKHYVSISSCYKSNFADFNILIKNNFKQNLITSSLQFKPAELFKLSLSYHSDNIFYNFSKKQIKFSYKNNNISFGKKGLNGFSSYFSDLSQKDSITVKNFIFISDSHILYHNKINDNFPFLEYKGTYKGIIKLKHNNDIFLGVKYFFVTKDKKIKMYDIFLSAFFGYDITDSFSIKAEFINITNEYSFNMLSLSPYHINVGFKWVFFN